MKKKPPVLRFLKPTTVDQPDDRHWRNGGDIEIGFYARVLKDGEVSREGKLQTGHNIKPTIQ